MKTARSLSYFSEVAATRIVSPRPASTTNHSSPAMIAVAGPACSGWGRGYPVPRRMRERLSNKFVIDDLGPRLHRASQLVHRGSRHPFSRHLLGLQHGDGFVRDVQDIDDAEVNAADVGGVVVENPDEFQVVRRIDANFLIELFAQPFHQRVSRIDVTSDADRDLVM